jgi:hypothetical protein
VGILAPSGSGRRQGAGKVVPQVFDVFASHAQAQESGWQVFLAGHLARRSMVLSTPPRLVADLMTRTESQTVLAAAAVCTSNPMTAPNAVICAAARAWPG